MKERGTLEKFDEAITIMLPVLWILLAIVALYTCCKVVFYWRFSVRKEPNQVQLEVKNQGEAHPLVSLEWPHF